MARESIFDNRLLEKYDSKFDPRIKMPILAHPYTYIIGANSIIMMEMSLILSARMVL